MAGGTFYLLLSVLFAKGSNAFKKCYNTSTETHCFEVQYNDTNNGLLTSSVDDARRRCSQRGATLVVIKNEEVNLLFQQFKDESGNPVSGYNIWTDALRIDDYSNTYTWHWINRKLPIIQASDVTYTHNAHFYVAVLEFRNLQYYLTAKHPGFTGNYICEYDESSCTPVVGNAKRSEGRCYVAYTESLTWYEARNRCLKRGGDLASFKNIKSFNFTSLLDFTIKEFPYRAYWLGLRFTWYTWNGLGTDIGYMKWRHSESQWNISRCLIVYFDCSNGCYLTPHSCDNTGDAYVVCHAGSADSLAVRIGVGVGVPVSIAIIAIIVIGVARRRRHLEKNSHSGKRESNTCNPTVSEQLNGTDEICYPNPNREQDDLTTYERIIVTEPYYEELQL